MKNNYLGGYRFLEKLGLVSVGTIMATSDWLSAFNEEQHTRNSLVRIGVIRPGLCRLHLISFLLNNKKAEITAMIYL